jgi:type VI secretion system secreted protein Hcp
MAIYMKYGDLKGEVTETKHKEWIACDSVQFGVGRSTSVEVGSGQEKRHRDQPTVTDLQVSRSSDSSSPLLFQQSVVGQPAKVEIHFLKPASGPDKEPPLYLVWDLRNCLITSYSVAGGAGGLSEMFGINFTAINIEYTPYDDKDKAGTPTRGFFDLVTAKATKWA